MKIGDKEIGKGHPTYIIAELGINHNGNLDLAKKLISAAKVAGCDAVKFQKRTVDVVYTPEDLARPRESVYGNTNGDLKRGLEFGAREYREIDNYCDALNIDWFASCWDIESVDFMEQFHPPAYKVASACITDLGLLESHPFDRPILLSTGMSTIDQIYESLRSLINENIIIMQCTSTYPSENNELNLSVIGNFRRRFGDFHIGYSGHERGIATTVAAVALGACVIERHITLDRTLWGSDQSSSLEPHGFTRLVRDIRAVEEALGDGRKVVYDSELPIIEKLRRVCTKREIQDRSLL